MKFSRDDVALDGIADIAQSVVSVIRGGDIVVLIGDIGAGKTTLVSAVATELGTPDPVTSPTFAIVAENQLTSAHNDIDTIIHVDTYRLTHVNELYDLGFETIFHDRAVTMIEWGERVEDYIDKNHFRLSIEEESPDSRAYVLELMGEHSQERVEFISQQLEQQGWIVRV